MKKILKIVFIILLILVFSALIWRVYIRQKSKKCLESTSISLTQENSPFSISKIVLYSSAYGENQNTKFEQNNWILNILQYTDIAIYINNSQVNLTNENTIKKLKITDLKIDQPSSEKANLYYLNTYDFGTPKISQNYKIEDSLEFSVLNDTNTENSFQYNTPIFFSDCSNPITLKYVNDPVKENFQVTTQEPISFDGTLLKYAQIPLQSLNSTIHFSIQLQNNNNDSYLYEVSLPIPLEKDSESIYNGKILVENSYDNMKFLKQ